MVRSGLFGFRNPNSLQVIFRRNKSIKQNIKTTIGPNWNPKNINTENNINLTIIQIIFAGFELSNSSLYLAQPHPQNIMPSNGRRYAGFSGLGTVNRAKNFFQFNPSPIKTSYIRM